MMIPTDELPNFYYITKRIAAGTSIYQVEVAEFSRPREFA
jgi:hypothetical protein